MSLQYPRIVIEFCTKCKWTLRASWYQQELFQTFGESLGEVALQPAASGTFLIILVESNQTTPLTLWDRKVDGGFPDAKVVKQRVRNALFPDKSLGHVDRAALDLGLLATNVEAVPVSEDRTSSSECKECTEDKV